MSPLPNSSPLYEGTPIRRLESLGKALGIKIHRLNEISRNTDNLYRLAHEVEKNDGSLRRTYDARPLLKEVQLRIKRNILDRVKYPEYLTGGIKGHDYKTNAELHQEAKIVFTEDIGNFFPSTTTQHVFDIWRNFFRFSSDVSNCLTALTTRCGELPQGAITSPQLANLAFWKDEPCLYDKLCAEGFIYSRFVDDIAVSSRTLIQPENKQKIIASVYGMVLRRGYRPKRCKHELKTSQQRMTVTTLTVNKKPGIARETRARIRAAVHHLECLALSQDNDIGHSKEYRSILGRVNNLGRFHPVEAKALKARLARLRTP